jgi:hypothetical protein
VPIISGFTTTFIGKVRIPVVLLVKLMDGLTEVAVETVEVPPVGLFTVQL